MMDEYLKEYPPVLRVKDVAEILGVSSKTVRHLVKEGAIFSIRIGRLIKIPKDSIVKYLSDNTATTNTWDEDFFDFGPTHTYINREYEDL